MPQLPDTLAREARDKLEALKAAPADSIRIKITSGIAPCIILPDDGSTSFLYMVLPVRLKAGES